MVSMMAAEQAPSAVTTSNLNQRFWWALLLTLVIVFAIWGLLWPPPYNLVLWTLAGVFLLVFIILIYRSARAPAKLDFSEVRRLIVCEQCGVETEGPYEKNDHVFRDIGSCPRCGGRLYIKAIYSIDAKTPLKRQQPQAETTASKTKVELEDKSLVITY